MVVTLVGQLPKHLHEIYNMFRCFLCNFKVFEENIAASGTVSVLCLCFSFSKFVDLHWFSWSKCIEWWIRMETKRHKLFVLEVIIWWGIWHKIKYWRWDRCNNIFSLYRNVINVSMKTLLRWSSIFYFNVRCLTKWSFSTQRILYLFVSFGFHPNSSFNACFWSAEPWERLLQKEKPKHNIDTWLHITDLQWKQF